MTHDELKEKIETLHEQGATPGAPTNPTYDSMYAFENALKAVVELHKPIFEDSYDWCMYCNVDAYPCPTIQVIEKELSNEVH